MEAHLRKITRSLGGAVTQLEQVSASEKTAKELDAEWMTRFHAGIPVPTPLDAVDAAETRAASETNGQDEADERGNPNPRWAFLNSTWLPLLLDLHRTVRMLDREETALQAAEEEEAKKAAARNPGGEEAKGQDAADRNHNRVPPRPPKGLLSLRDYTVIHAALQVVVHWGLGAVLEPGVGVFETDQRPRSRAVKISGRVLRYWGPPHHAGSSSCAPSAADTRAPTSGGADAGGVGGERSAYAQLALCASVIEGVVTTGQFMPMLLPLYLPDLLAARLQLVYGRTASAAAAAAAVAATATAAAAAPPANDVDDTKDNAAAANCCRSPKTSAKGGRSPPPPSAVTVAQGPHLPRSAALSSLRAVLKDVGPRQVMGALRHLLSQGGRAPPWLRQRAGRILSEIVLRPGGVQATLEVYLAGAAAGGGGGGGGEEGDEIKACLRVAKLLATPPKRVGSGDYVSRVAPQLAEMLHFDGQQRATVTRVIVMIVGRLSEAMPGDTRRLILFPLLRPLLRFWGPSGRQQRPSLSTSRPTSVAAKTKGDPPAADSKPIALSPTPPPFSSAAAAASPGGAQGGATAVPGAAREEAGQGGGGGGGGGGVGKDDIVSSEEALERCLEDLEKLLTAAPPPATLLGLLSGMGVAVPLYRLHCFCTTSKSRNLQSTKASLLALLPSTTTAAPDLVAGLLPDGKTGWGLGSAPRFSAGPTGGAVLRVVPSASGGVTSPGLATKCGIGGGGSGTATPPPTDQSLLGMEAALEGLGLDPETLRLVGSAAAAADLGGMGLGGEGGPGAGLIGALAGLKEAEGRARVAAELLEGLGEGSPVAGKVFDMLLRRYLSLRDGDGTPTSGDSATTAAARANRRSTEPPTPAEAATAEQHAVMASVVVLAERLGARVFGTGMQMLSCIRLVLEHEQPRRAGADGASGGPGSGSGDEYVDAAARVARMEAAEREDAAASAVASTGGSTATAEGGKDLGLGRAGEGGGDGGDGGDTLCSVVLALLTTILELGEEERTAEEEAELRAMLGPLKALAAGHRSAEVSEMSALLSASILSRGLSPEERREERERVKLAGQSDGVEGSEAPTANMLLALDAAEEDLRSEAVPMRARGVVTLTRLMRATLDDGAGGSSRGGARAGAGGKVTMDATVVQRLMDTFARMAGDGDSYVYLAAVQGLAALADALPGWCIPRLVGVFTAASGPGPVPGASGFVADAEAGAAPPPAGAAAFRAPLPLSQRLKIGEAVLLSARRCGDAMPKYAHLYVNAFVVAARERLPSGGGSDGTGTSGDRTCSGSGSSCGGGAPGGEGSGGASTPPGEREAGKGSATSLESKERCHFRASCLSNLAEVCQLLQWSLGRFSQDVVDLGVGVLSMETGPSEEATLARRGASFLLGRLLRGAGEDVLQVVPAAELRAVYRALRRCAERDPDEATRSHATNGLGCLDAAIRGQLFPAGGGDGGGGVGGGRGGGGAAESSSTAHHPGITVL
eukprot:g2714.t1